METDKEDNSSDSLEVSEGAKLENLISSLGQFGRYQRYVTFMSCIGAFMPAMVVVAMTFLAYEPAHRAPQEESIMGWCFERCQIPQCEPDLEKAVYNSTFLNFTTPYQVQEDRWSRCERYQFGLEARDPVENCQPSNFLNQTEDCGPGHVFDNSVFRSTTITDFDLWCSSPFYRSLAGMSYMLGMLLGAIILGDLSDRIGRRNALAVSSVILGACGIVSATAPNYTVFLVGRFFTGSGAVGMFQITFVLAVEFIGAKYRTFVGIMIEVPFALGEAMTGVLAYYIRDWRYLQLAVTVPAFFLISYRWVMPESVRWLVSQNRTEEAIATLRRVAKTNGKELTEESLDFIRDRSRVPPNAGYGSIKDSRVDLMANETKDQNAVAVAEVKVAKKTVIDLLKTPNMRKRSLNMFFCWAVVTFMYYGLSLNSSNIGGDLFLSFILTMLIEIPSYFFSWYALDRMGRKGTLMFTFLLGGISCIVAGVFPKEYTTTIIVMSLVGKFGAAAAFAIVYVYASEIFPTDLRGVGIGCCSMFARVGGTLAPLIVTVFKDQPAVAPVVFGVLSCLCGLMVTLLPETVGTRLPQTIAESEEFGSDQRTLDCCYCLSERRKRQSSDT